LSRNILLLAASLLAFPTLASAAPTVAARLNIGGATANPDHFSVATGVTSCPMMQLQLRVNKLVGPLNFTGEVRHAFCYSDKKELWGKSRYCAGIELPTGKNTFLFANYERCYRSNDDWAWCGISFRFDR